MTTRATSGRHTARGRKLRITAWSATAAVVALSMVDSLRTRSALRAIGSVDPSGDHAPSDDYELLHVPGVSVPVGMRNAAIAYAEALDLDALDLVPADIDVDLASDLTRAPLGGAGCALLVRRGLLDRAELVPGPHPPGDLAAATYRLSRFTQKRGLVLAPELRADITLADRRDRLEQSRRPLWRSEAASVAAAGTLLWAVVTAPATGVVGLIAYGLAPVLRARVAPVEITGVTRAAGLRAVGAPARLIAILRLPRSASADRRDREVAAARRWYDAALEDGVERFLEPRRTTCPWCGATAIHPYQQSRDIRQAKPGIFMLDKCTRCGHIFQNPRLTLEGLEFYYRDAYDGLSAAQADINFASLAPFYRSRAETVRELRPDTPRAWLDIGTGHGHFCQTARTVFPGTTFDGLDFTTGVLEGERRGWIDTAYYGLLLDRQEDIAGRYDQVSMHHYLEHTREPLREIDAAVKALSPDGWLMIEQPDPESRVSRLFGSWWAGWLQPEHLHMVTVGNVCAALEDRGLEIVDVKRADAHMPVEAFIVVTTLLRKLGPDPDLPWRQVRHPLLARARRLVGYVLVAPLLILVPFVDRIVIPRVLRSSHAYRILARRPQA